MHIEVRIIYCKYARTYVRVSINLAGWNSNRESLLKQMKQAKLLLYSTDPHRLALPVLDLCTNIRVNGYILHDYTKYATRHRAVPPILPFTLAHLWTSEPIPYGLISRRKMLSWKEFFEKNRNNNSSSSGSNQTKKEGWIDGWSSKQLTRARSKLTPFLFFLSPLNWSNMSVLSHWVLSYLVRVQAS